MDAETYDPACVLIHNHQDPVGPRGYRLTAALSRPVVMGVNPSNHLFVDCKVEGLK
jgi:hypothetical protein